MRHDPLIERGNSLPVTLEYYKQIDGKKTLVNSVSRDFSLNYFVRSQKKVKA